MRMNGSDVFTLLTSKRKMFCLKINGCTHANHSQLDLLPFKIVYANSVCLWLHRALRGFKTGTISVYMIMVKGVNWLWSTRVQSCVPSCGLHGYSLVSLVVVYMGTVLCL